MDILNVPSMPRAAGVWYKPERPSYFTAAGGEMTNGDNIGLWLLSALGLAALFAFVHFIGDPDKIAARERWRAGQRAKLDTAWQREGEHLRSAPFLTPALTAVALLAAVLPFWPYEFYMALRLLACGAGAWCAWQAWQEGRQGLAFALGAVALLFNPFVPAHLTRELWSVLNIAAAGLFGYAAYAARSVP